MSNGLTEFIHSSYINSISILLSVTTLRNRDEYGMAPSPDGLTELMERMHIIMKMLLSTDKAHSLGSASL